jgi:flagellar hook-associated protein 2
MASISLPGLTTGIDTSTIVAQLMAVEKARYNAYSAKKATYSNKLTTMNELSSLLTKLKTAAKDLSTTQKLAAYKVSSSKTEIATASASTGAAEGSYSIVVNQLATAERSVHNAGMEYAEDYVGVGNFIYSYNNEEVVVTTTSTTSLEDLVGLINNDASNPGVTASLLYYADTYHLVLNGNSAGSDYNITINESNTELWKTQSALTTKAGDNASASTKLIDLGQFTGGSESIHISGKTHDGLTDVSYDFAFNSSMKVSHLLAEIESAFDDTVVATIENGVISVTDTTSGESQMTISLSSGSFTLPTLTQTTDGGTVTANLDGFAALNFTETQEARDSQIRIDGYPAGDWISRSSNTVTDVIPGVTLDLLDTGTINLTITRDTAAIETKVQKLVDSYNAVAQYIKDNASYDASTKVAGILMGNSIVSNIKEAIRTPLTSQTAGFLLSADSLTIPANIGLSFDKDGVLSLDSEVFNKALSDNYSALLDLIAADKSGSSDSNYIKFYGASSRYTSAGTYDVQVNVSKGIAKIKLSTETTWRDATWSNNVITGSVELNSAGYPLYPENGLQLSVDLAQSGDFSAKIRIKEGFAGELTTRAEAILKSSTGSIALEEKYLEERISDMQTRMNTEQKRLAVVEQRLKDKFSRMEKALAMIQQQLSALSAYTSSSSS